MTLWASREGDKITLHGNIHLDVKIQDSRVAEWAVTEDVGHVRSFWGSLGTLVNEAEKDEAADEVAELEAGLDDGTIPGGF